MNFVGPVTESLHGNKYFLTILDDYSRFNWIIFLENKSHIFNKYHHWLKEINNIFNKPIKFIRTDNGLKFSNYKFNTLCSYHGIVHQYTIPHNLQLNGCVERLNGNYSNI